MSMLAGFSKIKITPGFPTCLACSQQKDTLFERVRDDIFVRCFLLNNDGKLVLILSYDLLFHSRDLYDFVYEYVSGLLSIKRSDILINYTHDHNAPSVIGYNDFSASEPYEDFLYKQTTLCIDAAIDGLSPVYMEYGVVPGNWNINRRRKTDEGVLLAPNPDGPADKDIYVLKFVSVHGTIQGLLVNYACHPVHYPDTLGLTSEYPGHLCRYIEKDLDGCTAMFIQGAGADTRPLGTVGDNGFVHRGYEYIEKMAESMKEALIASLGNFKKVIPSFSSYIFDIDVPTDDEGREHFQKCIDDKTLSAHLRRNARHMYEEYGSIPESFTLSCGLIKLSENLVIAHMGGEPVCGVKFNIESILHDYDVIFAGYTDACAYIVTDKMIDEGGYEVKCFLEYMHKGKISKGIDILIESAFSEARKFIV